MDMNNKKHDYDVDALLQKALGSQEFDRPSPELVHKLKHKLSEEKHSVINKRIIKPSIAIAAVLIATLSLSVVAFGEPVWRYLQTRIVEGGQYVEDFFLKESDDGFIRGGMTPAEDLEDGGIGRLVVEVEGELQVWSDPLTLTDLDKALSLFPGPETPMLPTYLPEGFAFESARFSICPINNPDVEGAGGQLFLTYGDGEQGFTIEIRKHSEEWGFDIWSSDIEEITINGRDAIIGDGALSVQASSGIRHTFMTWPMLTGSAGSDFGDDVLIRMAESLR